MKNKESLTKVDAQSANGPALVEAEKMFEKLAAITRETAARAHDFFVERGSQFGNHLEDWLRAESETLRTAPVKITETKNLVKVMIAVPGFKLDDIEITVKGDLLIVTGETASEKETDDENTFFSEWRSDRFMRTLTLPCRVETENVRAELEDGMLRLRLEKKAKTGAAKVAVKAA